MRRQRASRFHGAVAVAVAAIGLSASCIGGGRPIDVATIPPPEVKLPRRAGSVRFAAIGDTGTGTQTQYRVAAQMTAAHIKFPFEFVIMMGDNMYGRERPQDYESKFAIPYKPLLDAGVKFYASLGNHDETNQSKYKPFNMDGKRYYTFKPKDGIRFFALDSNYMSPEQLQWLEKELSGSGSDWKIAFFHHPIYSGGRRYGSNEKLRQVLEPLFLKYGIDVVFAGHEHFYERMKPQHSIYYFTSGNAARLRRGNINRRAAIHAAGFDQGNAFMLVEIAGDQMHFQAISDVGKTVDVGMVPRPPDRRAAGAAR